MLLTHMAAKGELPILLWAFSLPAFIALGAIAAVHEFGSGAEYVAYGLGAADFFIGFMTFTKSGREHAKMMRSLKASNKARNEYLGSEQFEIDQREKASDRFKKSEGVYLKLFKDVIDKYPDKEYTLIDADESEGIKGSNFYGLPILTEDFFILNLHPDRIIKLNPWKLNTADAVVADVPLTDPNNPIDGNTLADKLGGIYTRIYEVVEDESHVALGDDEIRSEEIWIFNIKDTNERRYNLLDQKYDLKSHWFSPSESRIPDFKKAKMAANMAGKAGAGNFIHSIFMKFQGYALWIKRSEEAGIPIVVRGNFLTSNHMNYIREDLIIRDSVNKL